MATSIREPGWSGFGARIRFPACLVRVMAALAAGWWCSAWGQGMVETLGGGPSQGNPLAYGWRDGDTAREAQFHTPMGLAVDRTGRFLYVADRDNGAVRRLDLQAGLTQTLLQGLREPIGVAVDGRDRLVVLERGGGVEGAVRRYDRFGNLLTNLASHLPEAAALAIGSDDEVLVVCDRTLVLRLSDRVSNVVGRVTAPGAELNGVVALTNGWLVLSDRGLHGLWLMDPSGTQTLPWTGFHGPGDQAGGPAHARFREPAFLARAGQGVVIVADRGNHRVKQVLPDGTVIPLYGVTQSDWLPGWPWPGWYDGEPCDHPFGSCAEAREPVGVAVGPDGTLYASEVYYHLIRRVTGVGLLPAEPMSRSDELAEVVQRPQVEPLSGYYPMGYRIRVTSVQGEVFYTVDGSDPTTNSFRVPLVNGEGWIDWTYTDRDLSGLRVRAFVGKRASAVVAGQPAGANEIGVPAWQGRVEAGIGSRVVIPVVANLRAGDRVRSFQYRLEVVPVGDAPGLSQPLEILSIGSNDFVRVVTAAQGGAVATYQAWSYSIPTGGASGQGLAVAALGTNANVSFENFAVVGMVAVGIPPTTREGDQYEIRIVAPSATSDGGQSGLPLQAMSPVVLWITNRSYLVGDTAPGRWYNAGGFGDGVLDNADVNHVFYASLGIGVPYPFTDAYDAMDVFPVDRPGVAGGDGLIRYLDWQIVLRRALGLDPQRWWRHWTPQGVRSASGTAQIGAAGEITGASVNPAGWVRHARVGLDSVGMTAPGEQVNVPLWVRTYRGTRLAGLQCRVEVRAETAGAPPVEGVTWQAAPGRSAPDAVVAGGTHLACGWSLGRLALAEGTSNLLGHVRVRLPVGAPPGARYRLVVWNADGAADLQTPYNLESRGAEIRVGAPAEQGGIVSDDWRRWFFGSDQDPRGWDESDPDDDGMPNWQEFLAGTHPLDHGSRFEVRIRPESRVSRTLRMEWSSVPGRLYEVWSTSDPGGGSWQLEAELTGTGAELSWETLADRPGPRFYRVNIQF